MEVFNLLRRLTPLAGLALVAGGVMTQALATNCCTEIYGNCPPVHGPGGVQPGMNCAGGSCCVATGLTGKLYRRCCFTGHCAFYSLENGNIEATCDGTVPWGTDPW